MTAKRPPYPFEDFSYRWIEPPEQDAPYAQRDRRTAMSFIALSFVGAGVAKKPGRTQRMVDIFAFVTEGRAKGNPKYSECVDFAGAALAMLGVRDERVINRNDDNMDGKPDAQAAESPYWWDQMGKHDWRVGQNVSMIFSGGKAAGAWVNAGIGVVPKLGDVFLLDYGTGREHVGVVASTPYKAEDGSWRFQTVEGGQVDEAGQCCQLFETTLHWQGSSTLMTRAGRSSRVLCGFIDVGKIELLAPAMVPPVCSNVGFPVSDDLGTSAPWYC